MDFKLGLFLQIHNIHYKKIPVNYQFLYFYVFRLFFGCELHCGTLIFAPNAFDVEKFENGLLLTLLIV